MYNRNQCTNCNNNTAVTDCDKCQKRTCKKCSKIVITKDELSVFHKQCVRAKRQVKS